jgi:hypothetical protein
VPRVGQRAEVDGAPGRAPSRDPAALHGRRDDDVALPLDQQHRHVDGREGVLCATRRDHPGSVVRSIAGMSSGRASAAATTAMFGERQRPAIVRTTGRATGRTAAWKEGPG